MVQDHPGAISLSCCADQEQLLQSLYGSVKRSSGSANKAIVAVAAAMLTSAYSMLKRGEPYRELCPDYRNRRDKAHVANQLIRRVQAPGFQVHLIPQAA